MRASVTFVRLGMGRDGDPNPSRRQHANILDVQQQIQQLLQQLRRAVVVIRNDSIDGALEVAEEWKPDSSSSRIVGHQRLIVGQRVVVKEEPRGDVESDEHVDGVMFVCGEDEEDAEHVQQPGGRVEEVEISRSICKRKKTSLKPSHERHNKKSYILL